MLQAVKAADVLMGNDAHCAAWIAAYGDPGRPRAAAPAVDGPAARHGGGGGA